MDNRIQRVLILGATSGIAEALARHYAKQKCKFVIVGRNFTKLEMLKGDLLARGAIDVTALVYDLGDLSKHTELVKESFAKLGSVDLAFLAHGVLGDPDKAKHDPLHVQDIIHINLTSPISLLMELALRFESSKSGMIAVVTSVAGDRGRSSNPVYGASKAGLSSFLSGLRQRLSRTNIPVLDIRPGFVITPMTQHIPGRKGLLWAAPAQVALGIVKAVEERRELVYLPGFWYWIMLIVRWIPERIFKGLRF